MSETADGEAVSDTSDIKVNHKHARAHKNGDVAEETEHDSYARAEKMLDEMGAKVGQYLANVGKHVTRWSMRAREEAEDIVIEAKDLRKRMKKA